VLFRKDSDLWFDFLTDLMPSRMNTKEKLVKSGQNGCSESEIPLIKENTWILIVLFFQFSVVVNISQKLSKNLLKNTFRLFK
jgi:hypothetical protein